MTDDSLPCSVSVIMTVRNGAAYVQSAIDSILTQSFRDFEFVIVNNGSTDETGRILADIPDSRLRVITVAPETNPTFAQGVSLAFNSARGSYVAVQDSDDLSFPTRLERQAAFLDSHPGAGLVACWIDLIDSNGRTFGQKHPPADAAALREKYTSDNPLAHASIMWRRTAAQAVGGYNMRYRNSCDYALALALLEAGHTTNALPETLAQIRIHPQQTMRSVETLWSRCSDAIELMERAQRLPDLSGASRAEGRRAVTKLTIQLGLDLIKLGEGRRGLNAFAQALVRQPLFGLFYAAYRAIKAVMPTKRQLAI